MENIYIKLLNEGTLVYRPVKARMVTTDTYCISNTNEMFENNEEWEFTPGNIVVTEKKLIGENEVDVAVSLAKSPNN